MAVSLDLTGSVTTTPAQGSSGFPSGTKTLQISKKRTHVRSIDNILRVSGTDIAPQPVPMGSIVNVRFFAVNVTGGEVRFRITTPDGATQIIPVTGTFLLDNPNEGSQVTAITVAADSPGPEVEYTAAGDP